MKLGNVLYYIFFFLLTLFKALGYASDDGAYLIVYLFGCMAVFLKIYSEKYTAREWIAMALIVAIGLMNWLIGGFTTILATAIALCGLKNIETQKLIRLSFWTRLLVLLSMIFLSVTGIIENEYREFYRNGEFIHRYLFGFGHPNTPQMEFAIVALLAIYIYGNRMKLVHYVLIGLGNQALFGYTYSRTGYLIVWVGMLLYFVLHNLHTRRISAALLKYLYVLIPTLTVALGLLYGTVEHVDLLDTLMTGRIRYVHEVLTEGLPPLFGTERYQELILDNGYMRLLYNGGILAFGWFSYHMMRISHRITTQKRYGDLFLIASFAIIGISESILDVMAVNVSLVFLGELIFPKKIVAADRSPIPYDIRMGQNAEMQ